MIITLSGMGMVAALALLLVFLQQSEVPLHGQSEIKESNYNLTYYKTDDMGN